MLGLAAVAGAYLITARFGIQLSVAHGVITPVWAPTGIALAVLVLFGFRFWPAVALGAFLANATSGTEPAVAAGIAVGNTLEALVGAYLLGRVGFRPSLARVRDVLALVLLAAGASTLVSATNGVTILYLTNTVHGSYGADWLLWWFGDAVGDLLVAPLLLVAFSGLRSRPPTARLLEGTLLLASLAALSATVFLAGAWRYPYLIFPLLLWAALRVRQLGVAAGSFLVGAIAIWGSIAGTVPTTVGSTEGVQVIQALVAVVAVSLLVVAATLAERERAHAQLAQTAAGLSEAQALTHIGNWEWEIATNTVTWSDELYRIWGLAPQRFGASYEAYLETVHPAERDEVDRLVRQGLETGGFDYECRIVRPDGTERFIHARGKVVARHGGEPARMIGTAQDITERRRIDAERERILDRERAHWARTRELDRLKDTFLASVSHELLTPLTSIKGFIDLLQDGSAGELTDEQRRYLAIASRNNQRLERQIGKILAAAGADSAHPMRKPSRVDLRALAAEYIRDARPHADDAGVELVLTEGQALPIEGDPARLTQLIANLVSNAIKFTPRGGRVEVRTRPANGHGIVEVADNGIGIPFAEQYHVFERFFRSSSATAQAIPGTGLGLSIAKTIADAHGGSITFKSSEGKGTTFRVQLPLSADPTAGTLRTSERRPHVRRHDAA